MPVAAVLWELWQLTHAWEQRKFGDLLNYERPDKYIVKNTRYISSGTPVLTANKSFILGYSHETNSYHNLPAIIFDDFTLDNKLVYFPFLVKSSAIKILTSRGQYPLRFIYELLQHTRFINEGHARHYISVVQKKNVMVPLATEEQTKIDNIFSKLDKLIALQQRKLELLKIVRKALLDKSFADHANPSPQLRFKKFNGNWNHCKLGDIAHLVTGNDGNVDKLPILTISAANGWMLQKERFSKVIAGTELKRYTLLRKGELSYNHGNSKLATYGVVFMLDDYDKALVPKVYHSFKVTGANYPKFIETCFSTHKPDRELRKLITSGARMDGLLNITKEEFFSIKLFVPTFTEQLKIADLFTGSDKVINLQRQEVSQLNMTRKFLLQNMFI